MKKYPLPICLVVVLIVMLLISTNLNGQNPLSLSWDGYPISDTLYVYGSLSDKEIVAHAVVTNNTNESVDIKVRRQRLIMQEGSSSFLCWGMVYPPDIEESLGSFTYEPGESSPDDHFQGHYMPEGIWGSSMVKYTFFDTDNENLNVSMVVVFSATTTGIEDIKTIKLSMYPNPATDQMMLQSNRNIKKVTIFDLFGKKLITVNPNQNNVKLNLEFLCTGHYLVNIETEIGIQVRKCIIL